MKEKLEHEIKLHKRFCVFFGVCAELMFFYLLFFDLAGKIDQSSVLSNLLCLIACYYFYQYSKETVKNKQSELEKLRACAAEQPASG